MTEQEAIERHLSAGYDEGGFHHYSSFEAVLKDARRVTGRDVRTGKLLCRKHAGSWIGALGYLALLDQIGKCFKPKDCTSEFVNFICRALDYFSSLSAPEIWAIYALRCAFAHDYSLFNCNPKPERQHRFVVSEGRQALVTLPQNKWDGVYGNQDSRCVTTVDLQQFCELVETIVRRVRELAEQRQLEIVLEGGAAELVSRYSMVAGPI